MRLAIIVPIVLLACGCPQDPTNAISTTVDTAIRRWQSDTGISVTTEARKEIFGTIVDNTEIVKHAAKQSYLGAHALVPSSSMYEGDLLAIVNHRYMINHDEDGGGSGGGGGQAAPVYPGFHVRGHDPAIYERLEVAIESYLYFVRYKKLQSTIHMLTPLAPTSAPPKPSAAKLSEINVGDIVEYPFKAFLASIQKLILDPGTGVLIVQSRPPEAQIKLDGDLSGGTTNK